MPTTRSSAQATAMCPAEISSANLSGVVRSVPSAQSPSSATAYTRLTSAASWSTNAVSSAAAAGAIRTTITPFVLIAL